MNKQDIFYYAKADGIPCYYQPETEEIIPQNKLCELLMDIQIWFWDIFGTPEQFKIVIYHKAIIRQKIEKVMQSMILKTKKENARLKADYKGLYKLREEENKGISKKIADLEKENLKIKQGCHKWFKRWREVKREELEAFSKIAKLEQQIEQMKCCANCKHSRTEYEHCRTNKHEKWEIKEK